MKSDDELRLVKENTDNLNFRHRIYQQYYKGIRVEFSQYLVHAKGNIIQTINGNFEDINISVKPSINEGQALNKALTFVNSKKYKWQDTATEKFIKQNTNNPLATYFPKGELVICKDFLLGAKNLSLSWRFVISSLEPNYEQIIYVDAIDGQIINNVPLIYEENVPMPNVPGTADTRYSGNQNIIADDFPGGFRLRENRNNVNIATFNCQRQANYVAATDFVDNDNFWSAQEWVNGNHDQAALDAHWAEEIVLDYWRTVFNRNSINGNGIQVTGYVHYFDANSSAGWPNNAQWDGTTNTMRYGDGDGFTFLPLTSIDVCAHEFGHGVCQYTANLAYVASESGALNEGFSDIWGACVEHWAAPNKQTWLIGEEITLINPGYLRSLVNPKTSLHPNGDVDTYHGINWYSGTDISRYTHENMSVLTHWFYLLSQGGNNTNDNGDTYLVNGIGIDEASQIAFRAESVYLHATSDYADARTQTIQAARDLYGTNSCEEIAVTNAWFAVGVGAAYPANAGFSISGDDNFCTSSNYMISPSLPAGANATWLAFPRFSVTLNPTTGNSTTVTKQNGGLFTLTANITNFCGGNNAIVIQRNLFAGPPPITIYGPYDPVEHAIIAYPCVGHEYYFEAGDVETGQSYTWTLFPPPGSEDLPTLYSGSRVYMTFNETGYYTLHVEKTNSCGSTYTEMTLNCQECLDGFRIIASPNPATNVLNVTTDNETAAVKALSNDENVLIELYDSNTGLKQKQWLFKNSQKQFVLSLYGVNKGVCILKVSKGKYQQSIKVIIK